METKRYSIHTINFSKPATHEGYPCVNFAADAEGDIG